MKHTLIIFSLLLILKVPSSAFQIVNTTVKTIDTTGKKSKDTVQLSKEIILRTGALPVFKKDTLALQNDQRTGKANKSVSTFRAGTIDAGRTASSLDVSGTGGAVFTMPFTLPPGLKGSVPQLALSYNSQGGNGMAGCGWSISGISSISRIPSTAFHDNRIDGINFNSNDRFALDGQRLLLKSGSYGADGAEYQTENYSNLRIFSRGVSPYGSGYGPEYFELFFPDGSKAFYGLTANSRTPSDYAITYSETFLGARINYSYTQNVNALAINQINYGNLGATPGLNQINFIYGTATRAEQGYVGGLPFYRNEVLNKISIVANGAGFRNYVLSYDNMTTLNYQRLSAIQEFDGAETKALEPIYFSYGATGDAITTSTISPLSMSGIASNNSQVITADFTGNGTMDFLLFPIAKNKFYAFYDMEPGSPYLQLGFEVNTGTFREIFPATWLTHNEKVLAGQGMIVVKESGANGYKFEMLSSGTVAPVYYQYEKTWDSVPYAPDYPSTCDYQYHTNNKLGMEFISGDFNGDGLSDIIALNHGWVISDEYLLDEANYCIQNYTNIGSSVYFINMDRRLTSNYISNIGMLSESFSFTHRLYTGDFNGDGRTDILQVAEGVMYVYSLNSVSNALELLWQRNDSRITINYPLLLGDYNGDGKMDVMFPTGNNSLFATFMSTGKEFLKHEQNQSFSNSAGNWNGTTLSQYYLIPNDVDGDGKTDIIKSSTLTQNNSSGGTANVEVYHNSGISSTYQPSFTYGGATSIYTNLRHNPIPLFLNPDRLNHKLEFGFISDQSIALFRFAKDFRKEAQMETVAQDGISYNIDYRALLADTYNNDIPLYQSSYDQTYPYIDLHDLPSTNVVSKLTRYYGNEQISQVFGYAKAVSHAGGLGFMGFGELTRSNWHVNSSDLNRAFSISIQSPQLRGANVRNFATKSTYLSQAIKDMALSNAPSSSAIADGASITDYVNRTDQAYVTQLLSNKVYVNIPVATASKDMLENSFSVKTLEYDSYYNNTKTISTFNGTVTQTTEATYDNNPSGNYIGRLLTMKTAVNNGSDSFSTEDINTYSGFLPTQIKKKGNNTPFNTEDLTYDVYGNVTQKTVTTSGGAQRTTSWNFDASGRFMTQSTDIEGLVTTYLYDGSTGNLQSETNPYGQTNTFQYDSWGRQVVITDYLGENTYRSFQRNSGNVEIADTDDEGRAALTIMNVLGQTVETRQKTVLGQFVGKAYQFDVYGRATGQSQATQVGSYNQWDVTEYDEYGRIKRVNSFTGKVSNFSYNGLSTTVNDGTKSVTTSKNALGKVSSIQDPGGTINYSYFANGNLRTADYSGIILSIEQDGWGRQTKLIDPSAGIYQYEYDDFGQLTKEITPKGSTENTYDVSGKLTAKKVIGDDTNLQYAYTYDVNTKLLSNMTLANSDGNNANYTYTYDGYKRLSSSVEDNLHARFTKNYTYDSYGRIGTETMVALNKLNNLTAQKTIEKQYQNGELLQASLQGTGQLIWKINTQEPNGALKTSLQGSSLKSTFQYDQYGLPQQRSLEKITGNPVTLMDLGYSFDAPRGLMNSRSNSAFTWSESFSYDSQNRLTAFNDNNGNNSQDYDNRGRITGNALGNYSYDGNTYRQSELALNPAADSYYQAKPLQQISYNAFKAPVEIIEQGIERISFQYNAEMGRSHMYYGDQQADKLLRRFRRHYAEDGSMEITNDLQNGTTSFVFYLEGDGYTAPAIWKEVFSPGQVTQDLYYLHRDHQGSIVMITNEQGDVVEKRIFDAWGNVLKIQDGNNNDLASFVILDRGFTGHEHLMGVGLINMNGRLYDPKLHRFLSPDNFVQDIYNTQNFNRYAYGLNNPLSFTDPSGEFLHLIIGAIIGGVVNWVSHGFHFTWKGLAQFGVGALAGALGAGVGAGVSSALAHGSFAAGFLGTSSAASVASGFFSGAVVGAAGGAAGGFVSGFGNGIVDGNSFGSSLGNGAKSAAIGAVGGGAIAGAIGGIQAAADGRNFWSGAGTSTHDIPIVGTPGETYSSTADVRSDYNTNIGSIDHMSLEQVEAKLKTTVSLADNTNIGSSYTINEYGQMTNPGGGTVGAVTFGRYEGRFFARLVGSRIVIAPDTKALGLNLRNMIFKHEFMHAWHMTMGDVSMINTYSEKATSSFSYVYVKAFNSGIRWENVYKANLGAHPLRYTWRTFNKIVPLWLR